MSRLPLTTPPRLRPAARERGRDASALELFYDLVFALVVGQAADALSRAVSARTLAHFTAVLLPVWFTWVGHMVYANRYDTDDVVHRVAIFAQMYAAAVMAVHAGDAYGGLAGGESADGGGVPDPPWFALAYVFARLVLVALYVRAYRAVPETRPTDRVYLAWYAASAALWAGAAWATAVSPPAPWHAVVWGALLAGDLLVPLAARHAFRAAPIDARHMRDRVGSFVLIVLYVAVWGVVQGVTNARVRRAPASVTAVPSMLAFVIGAALWWLYFAYLDRRPEHERRLGTALYTTAHVPLLVGVSLTGVGLEQAITDAPSGVGARLAGELLFVGPLLWLAAFYVVRRVTDHAERARTADAVGRWYAGAGLVIGLTGLASPQLSALRALAIVAAALVTLVVRDVCGGTPVRSG